MAHEGTVHTSLHGGTVHSHDKDSHNHPVMVHALDKETLRAVDTAVDTGVEGGQAPTA